MAKKKAKRGDPLLSEVLDKHRVRKFRCIEQWGEYSSWGAPKFVADMTEAADRAAQNGYTDLAFTLESEDDYGERRTVLKLIGTSSETDDEVRARLKQLDEQRLMVEKYEREQLSTLLKKYLPEVRFPGQED